MHLAGTYRDMPMGLNRFRGVAVVVDVGSADSPFSPPPTTNGSEMKRHADTLREMHRRQAGDEGDGKGRHDLSLHGNVAVVGKTGLGFAAHPAVRPGVQPGVRSAAR